MEITKIYLDMDGVLTDFNGGVQELCGITPVDIGKASQKYTDALFEAMSKVPHFYYKLKPLPGAAKLFNMLRAKYGDKVEILSGVPKPERGIETAEEDKRRWVRDLLSPEVTVNLVFGAEKSKYCKDKSYILIDDFERNIKRWENSGGTGILSKNTLITIKQLKEMSIL